MRFPLTFPITFIDSFIIEEIHVSSLMDNLNLVEPPGVARTLTGIADIRKLDGSYPEIYTLGGTRWN